ncbi:MAG: hypothetical protein V4598_09380 [Bdellovibrionota bacterium]
MIQLLLIFFCGEVLAQATKADFFPRFPNGNVIEEREFEKGMEGVPIERSQEEQNFTYRYVVNFKKLQKKMPMDIAVPILQLSQFSWCSRTATQPLAVNNHAEAYYVESYFKCVTPPDYDPVALRKKMKDTYCPDSAIKSKAQYTLCKELLMR